MNEIRKINHRREIGLDLIKILACLGVVSLHTLYPGKGWVNRGITLLAGMSIPLFFMVSGYLMFRRESLDYKYAFRKIGRILLVCFSWELLHAAAYFLYYREMRNFLTSFLMDFFQQGLFYHFWYMGALIIVYLAMPLMHKIMKRSWKVFCALLTLLSAVCAVIDIVSIIAKRQFILDIPQNLRIWTWLFYAMAGGYAAAEGNAVKRIAGQKCSVKCLLLLAAVGAATMWQLWIGKTVFGGVVIEAFYGALTVQAGTIMVFLSLYKVQFQEKTEKAVISLAGLTMGIYIMHPFVLAVLEKFIPVFTQGGAMENLLFWILTVVTCGIGTAICRKIPVVNRLLRL